MNLHHIAISRVLATIGGLYVGFRDRDFFLGCFAFFVFYCGLLTMNCLEKYLTQVEKK